ncbi:T4 RnlA family RNA ligase [Bacillus thuringiensis]|uniref:T4 RnlA family RNA ligase n=1 Tax=Bacillus thuringiensis TaxID=1428 RepID=UPI003F5B12FA
MQLAQVDYDKYKLEVDAGFISERVNPMHPELIILNYTNLAVINRRWNNETMNARGLILNRDTLEVLAKPFPKFFNYNENLEYQREIPKCNCEPPVFTVKQDGSLGISYMVGDNLFWATRGSFESDQARVANEIWRRKYAAILKEHEDVRELMRGITLLVEIIDPQTKIVVDYEGLSDLILIGAVDIRGKFPIDLDYDSLTSIGQYLGMPVTNQVELTIDEAVKLKETIPSNQEGWVLKWKNGKRLKVKGDNYMDVHRVAYGISLKKKIEYWKNDKLMELISQVPEEFRNEIEEFQGNWDNKLEELIANLQYIFDTCHKDVESRKDFATNVNFNEYLDDKFKGIVFKAFESEDKQINRDVVKEVMHKYYREFTDEGVEE